MHLEPEQIQRFRHRELSPGLEVEVRAHLDACEMCRGVEKEQAAEESELFSLLESLDGPRSGVNAADIVARSRARSRRLVDPRAWSPRFRWAAAALFLILLGGAVYAAPGSLLRAWVGDLIEKMNRDAHHAVTSTPAERTPIAPTRERDESGIAIDPGASLVISFASRAESCFVHVELTDDAEVAVRGPSDLGAFTSDAGRLRISNRSGHGTFRVLIPSAAPRVLIDVAGRPIFEKRGAQVTTSGATDGAGGYTLSLGP